MQLIEALEQRLVLSAAFDVTGLTALRNDPGYDDIDGSGVGIAILDTGVYAKNPDLQSNVVAFYNAVEDAVPSSIDSTSVKNATDTEGHGTHVSGIAASSNPDIGVAYQAQLIDVKVIPDDGESELGGDPLLRGLQFVAQYADQFNIKVVNMSLGEADQNGGLNLNSVPNADDISRAIQELESMGITVVSAAGNSYANDPEPGASYPAVVSTLSVASTWADSGTDYDFNVVAWGSGYDNYAAYEDSAAADRFSATSQRSTLSNQVAAPGVNIYSTWNNSSSDSSTGSLLYNTLSGTSMAAPFISGVVALIQDAAYTFGGQYLTDTTQIRQIIQQTADLITDSTVSDNGRVALVNGEPITSYIYDLPETGETYYRVNVQKAIQYVRQLFNGGVISTADLDNTTATATNTTALTGTRTYSSRGTIGSDGLNQVGANDVDLYKITLKSPGVLSVALSQPSGGTAFAAELRLFDAQGNPVTDLAGTSASYPTLTSDTNTPLAIGTYYLGISSIGNANYVISDGSGAAEGSSTGDYALIIGLSNPDPNGVAQGAKAVDLTDPNVLLSDDTVANEFQGSIGTDPPLSGSNTRTAVPDGDVDMFKVIAPDSGVLTIQTDTSSYGMRGVDSYVCVFDESLNQVAYNDDISRFNTDSHLQVKVQVGQTYYVAVTNYANRSFDVRNPYGRVANSSVSDCYYDLYLAFSNGDKNGTAFLATAATVGRTVTDRIGSDSGQALTGANGGAKDVDFYYYTASSTGLLDLSVTATTDGFSPSLQLWTVSADQTSLQKIGTASGSGNGLIVQVTKGQTLYVSVTGKGNENFSWYAPGSGAGGQTGGYSLVSKLRPTSDYASLSDGAIQKGTPQAISAGTGVYSNLGQDGSLIVGSADVDLYKLTPTATGVYELHTDTSREGSADTVLRLFDAQGNQLAVNDNQSDRTTSSLIRIELTAGATYYIGVSGAGTAATAYNPNTGAGAAEGSTGTYGLLVSKLANLTLSSNAPVREPSAGQTTAIQFTVKLDAATTTPVTVDYATADGTALAGHDYVATAGTLTFAPGETTKTVEVLILSDTSAEPDETFTLQLSTASSNAAISDSTATGTIQDLSAAQDWIISDAKIASIKRDGDTLLALNAAGLVVTSQPLSEIQNLIVMGTSGNDVFTFDFSGGDLVAAGQTVTFNGIAGNDTAILQSSSGNSTLALAEGSVNWGNTRIELSDVEHIDIALGGSAQATLTSSASLTDISLFGTAALSLANGGDKLLKVNTLSLGDQTRLDLADNNLIVSATPQTRQAVLATLSHAIQSARGTDASGVGSSAANVNPQTGLSIMLNDKSGKPILTTFAGQPVTPNDILVKYTWTGDVNLDGSIDAADYFLIDSGFLTQQGQYRNGDLNLDGAVDAADYFLIDSAFLAQTAPLASQSFPTLPDSSPSALQQLFSLKPIL